MTPLHKAFTEFYAEKGKFLNPARVEHWMGLLLDGFKTRMDLAEKRGTLISHQRFLNRLSRYPPHGRYDAAIVLNDESLFDAVREELERRGVPNAEERAREKLSAFECCVTQGQLRFPEKKAKSRKATGDSGEGLTQIESIVDIPEVAVRPMRDTSPLKLDTATRNSSPVLVGCEDPDSLRIVINDEESGASESNVAGCGLAAEGAVAEDEESSEEEVENELTKQEDEEDEEDEDNNDDDNDYEGSGDSEAEVERVVAEDEKEDKKRLNEDGSGDNDAEGAVHEEGSTRKDAQGDNSDRTRGMHLTSKTGPIQTACAEVTKTTEAPKSKQRSGREFLIPLVVIEHKREDVDQNKRPLEYSGNNQRLMYCTSAARFLYALGITNMPIFGITTAGSRATVSVAWCTRDEVSLVLCSMNVCVVGQLTRCMVEPGHTTYAYDSKAPRTPGL